MYEEIPKLNFSSVKYHSKYHAKFPKTWKGDTTDSKYKIRLGNSKTAKKATSNPVTSNNGEM